MAAVIQATYFYKSNALSPGYFNLTATNLFINQIAQNNVNLTNIINASMTINTRITIVDNNNNSSVLKSNTTPTVGGSFVVDIPITIISSNGSFVLNSSCIVIIDHIQSMNELADVSITAPTYGQLIGYDTTSAKYINNNFVWQDLLGLVQVRSGGGANDPQLTNFKGVQYEYSCNNATTYIYFTFHMPHDWAVNSDMFIHLHHASNTIDAGTAVFEVISSVAKSGSAFGNDVTTLPITHTNFGQYVHNVTEVGFATLGGGLNLHDTANLDVDSLIQVRLSRVRGVGGDTAGSSNIFIFQLDIHYQSDGRVGTKNKVAPFNV